MALVNEHFLKLPGSYLFSDIAKKVNTFRITHPKQDIIRLGIGDVTQPLPPACLFPTGRPRSIHRKEPGFLFILHLWLGRRSLYVLIKPLFLLVTFLDKACHIYRKYWKHHHAQSSQYD